MRNIILITLVMIIIALFPKVLKISFGVVLLLFCLAVCVGGMMYDALKGKTNLIK